MFHVAKASTPEILETAFAAIAAAGPGALLVMQDALLFNQHPRIVAFAAASGLPALFAEKQVVESGGLMALMAYGASITASFRRAAVYVVKYTAALAPPICRLRPRQHSSSRSILKHELNSFSEEYRHELDILRIADRAHRARRLCACSVVGCGCQSDDIESVVRPRQLV